ncbi:MAG: hypothetical protein C0520_02065 [Sphingopyxis sp.]|nr:hypothetical protein [Sphingopyxis sp.]
MDALKEGQSALRRASPPGDERHVEDAGTGRVSRQAAARPDKVRAVIAVEPTANASRAGKGPATRCGITHACLHFAPALAGPDDLDLVRTERPAARGTSCWLQRTARYRLPALDGIPIPIATGEVSYHAGQDYCTSAFLTQAGVANDYAYLPEHGIRGNRHMQMLEKNNLEIAAFYEVCFSGGSDRGFGRGTGRSAAGPAPGHFRSARRIAAPPPGASHNL